MVRNFCSFGRLRITCTSRRKPWKKYSKLRSLARMGESNFTPFRSLVGQSNEFLAVGLPDQETNLKTVFWLTWWLLIIKSWRPLVGLKVPRRRATMHRRVIGTCGSLCQTVIHVVWQHGDSWIMEISTCWGPAWNFAIIIITAKLAHTLNKNSKRSIMSTTRRKACPTWNLNSFF